MPTRKILLAALAMSAACACADVARLPESQTTGPEPVLPQPTRSSIPTVDIARARGWQGDGKPVPAPPLAVNAFARELSHPRWLYVLPNGDVLVAETNAPPREGDGGLRAWAMG